jgi:hypothetical protein
LQLCARRATDGDVRVARDLKNLAQARLVRPLGQRQALDGPHARAQRFEDGLHAEDVRAVLLRARPPRVVPARAGRVRVALSIDAPRARFFAPRALFVPPGAVFSSLRARFVTPRAPFALLRTPFVMLLRTFVLLCTAFVVLRITFAVLRTPCVVLRTACAALRMRLIAARTAFVALRKGFVAARVAFAAARAALSAALVGTRDAVAGSFAPALVSPAGVAVARASALPPVVAPLLHKLFARAQREPPA